MAVVVKKITSTDALNLLQFACERNTSADILMEQDGESVSARLRLLACSHSSLIVDQPYRVGKPLFLRRNQAVSIYFLIGGKRYGFTSRVDAPVCLYDLNPRKKILAACLRLPLEVEVQQRRKTFRVSVAAQDYMLRAHQVELRPNLVSPDDALRFEAKVADISAGGVGILVPREDARQLRLRDYLFLDVLLEGEPEGIRLLGEIRQFRQIPKTLDYRVGLMFVHERLLDDFRSIEAVQRLIMAEQRRQLRCHKV